MTSIAASSSSKSLVDAFVLRPCARGPSLAGTAANVAGRSTRRRRDTRSHRAAARDAAGRVRILGAGVLPLLLHAERGGIGIAEVELRGVFDGRLADLGVLATGSLELL